MPVGAQTSPNPPPGQASGTDRRQALALTSPAECQAPDFIERIAPDKRLSISTHEIFTTTIHALRDVSSCDVAVWIQAIWRFKRETGFGTEEAHRRLPAGDGRNSLPDAGSSEAPAVL